MANHPDSVNAILLDDSNATGVSIGAGKVGNAILSTRRYSLQTSQYAALKFTAGQDLTICGWTRAGANGVAFYFDFADEAGTNEVFVTLESKTESGAVTGFATMYGTVDQGSNVVSEHINVGVPAANSGWYFWLFQVDSRRMGMQINNATITNVSTLLSGPFVDSVRGYLNISTATIGGATQSFDFDEVAIFNSLLTDVQKAIIYNGGAGVTWPVTL